MTADVNIFATDDDSRADGSTPLSDRRTARDILDVYQAGRLSVVGFGGVDVPDVARLANYKKQLTDLIWSHGCEVLAIVVPVVRLRGGYSERRRHISRCTVCGASVILMQALSGMLYRVGTDNRGIPFRQFN